MAITRYLKYLPLSGVFSLALSLAYVLRLAAKNAWAGDAPSISSGPAKAVRDYIPIVYGEWPTNIEISSIVYDWQTGVEYYENEWTSQLEIFELILVLASVLFINMFTASIFLWPHIHNLTSTLPFSWSLILLLYVENVVTAASMILYYIFLFNQSAVAFSEFNKSKMLQENKKSDDNTDHNAPSLGAIKYGSDNANVLAANRL